MLLHLYFKYQSNELIENYTITIQIEKCKGLNGGIRTSGLTNFFAFQTIKVLHNIM